MKAKIVKPVSNTRVMICGGHLSPALALIERLEKKSKIRIFYVGRKFALEGDKATSFEYFVISQKRIPFFSLYTGRLQRNFSIQSILSLIKLPIGFLQSAYYLLKVKPHVIISFGSYVALPVSIMGKIFGISIVVHEQTAVLGFTNRILSRICDVLCTSWKNTAYIPKHIKIIHTGNLLRRSIYFPSNTKRSRFVVFGNNSLPLLYITGGSLGSVSLNQIVKPLISTLVNKYRVLHQCGYANKQKDYKEFLKMGEKLPKLLRSNYYLCTHIPPDEIGSILKECTCVISRSGANTVSELAVFSVPSILIPLPWSADNEQRENARMLVKLGIAHIVEQNNLTSNRLLQEIEYMRLHKENIKKSVNETQKVNVEGIERFIEVLADVLQKKKTYE